MFLSLDPAKRKEIRSYLAQRAMFYGEDSMYENQDKFADKIISEWWDRREMGNEKVHMRSQRGQ